ncbi:MAG: pilus assembly protein N-terminal domain-containing protein [Candidatus Margulisbacteria bacterium]|jgi:hypothetical protein|nr:pilus assembly protein N-terminal domain-containing protein [Candidatus Margulisiibacteriota bacterium]
MKKICLALVLLLAIAGAAQVELTAGASYSFKPAAKVARFVNAAPQIVDVSSAADGSLLIKAKERGTARIFYWTAQQEVLLVQVNGRKAEPAAAARSPAKNNGKWETYFKFDPVNATPVNQKMILNSLEYSTAVGDLDLDFFTRYRYNAVANGGETGQVERLNARLAGRGSFLEIGDTTVRYSELAVPYLDLQGLAGHYSFGGGRTWALDAFIGQRPGNFWGSEVGENYIADKDREVSVGGARISWRPLENFDLAYLTASRRAEKDNMLGSYSLHSAEVGYKWSDYAAFLELAETQKDHAGAARTELHYDTEKYGWQIAYRDIAPEYRALSDYFNYTGLKGWYLYGSARPLRLLSLSGSYETYLQRFDQEKLTNPDYAVERLRLRLGLDKVLFFRPAVSYYSNYRDNFRSSGVNAQLYEIELWRRRLWASYNLSTWRYESPSAEYSTDRAEAGLNYQQNWFGYRATRVDERARYVFGGNTSASSGWDLVATFGEFKLPYNSKISVSHWYQTRKNTLDTLDKNKNSLRLAFGQSFGDLYWYLNGVVSRENSLFYEYEGEDYDREGYYYHDKLTQSEISGGLVYKF